jgi:hypothetical protein
VRRGQRRREGAFDAHRGEPTKARRKRDRGRRRGELSCDAVDGQAEQSALRLAGRPGSRRRFGIGHVAVAVLIDLLALLEGGDLGHVDDDIEADLVRRDGDPGVVVDREVAERVGKDCRRDGGAEQCERGGPDEAERATSHHAEGTRSGPDRMTRRRPGYGRWVAA